MIDHLAASIERLIRANNSILAANLSEAARYVTVNRRRLDTTIHDLGTIGQRQLAIDIADRTDAIRALETRRGNLEKSYDGWTRYWRSETHLHARGTCGNSSDLEWLTLHSGHQLEDVVRETGLVACSKCLPIWHS